MAFLKYGLAKGLAFGPNWDSKVSQMQQRMSLIQRQKEYDVKKASSIADQTQAPELSSKYYQDAMNDWLYKYQIPKIGKLVTENPNWDVNAEKQVEFKQLIGEINNNPIVKADKLTKESTARLLYDYKVNPDDPFVKQKYDEFLKHTQKQFKSLESEDDYANIAPFEYYGTPGQLDIAKEVTAIPIQPDYTSGGIKYLDKTALDSWAKMIYNKNPQSAVAQFKSSGADSNYDNPVEWLTALIKSKEIEGKTSSSGSSSGNTIGQTAFAMEQVYNPDLGKKSPKTKNLTDSYTIPGSNTLYLRPTAGLWYQSSTQQNGKPNFRKLTSGLDNSSSEIKIIDGAGYWTMAGVKYPYILVEMDESLVPNEIKTNKDLTKYTITDSKTSQYKFKGPEIKNIPIKVGDVMSPEKYDKMIRTAESAGKRNEFIDATETIDKSTARFWIATELNYGPDQISRYNGNDKFSYELSDYYAKNQPSTGTGTTTTGATVQNQQQPTGTPVKPTPKIVKVTNAPGR